MYRWGRRCIQTAVSILLWMNRSPHCMQYTWKCPLQKQPMTKFLQGIDCIADSILWLRTKCLPHSQCMHLKMYLQQYWTTSQPRITHTTLQKKLLRWMTRNLADKECMPVQMNPKLTTTFRQNTLCIVESIMLLQLKSMFLSYREYTYQLMLQQ